MKKLIVIEIGAMGGEFYEVKECDENNIASTIKHIITHHDAVYTEDACEDEPTGNIKGIKIYDIPETEPDEFDPSQIIKEQNDKWKKIRDEQNERSERSQLKRLQKKYVEGN